MLDMAYRVQFARSTHGPSFRSESSISQGRCLQCKHISVAREEMLRQGGHLGLLRIDAGKNMEEVDARRNKYPPCRAEVQRKMIPATKGNAMMNGVVRWLSLCTNRRSLSRKGVVEYSVWMCRQPVHGIKLCYQLHLSRRNQPEGHRTALHSGWIYIVNPIGIPLA